MSYKFELDVKGNDSGRLVVLESNKDIPFDIKRIFYIYDVEAEAVRGLHANRKSSFFFICVAGSCNIEIDNGFEKHGCILDKPSLGLHCPKGYWKKMFDFSQDAILLVLSDETYDEDEYIRDYEVFKESIKK